MALVSWPIVHAYFCLADRNAVAPNDWHPVRCEQSWCRGPSVVVDGLSEGTTPFLVTRHGAFGSHFSASANSVYGGVCLPHQTEWAERFQRAGSGDPGQSRCGRHVGSVRACECEHVCEYVCTCVFACLRVLPPCRSGLAFGGVPGQSLVLPRAVCVAPGPEPGCVSCRPGHCRHQYARRLGPALARARTRFC